MHGTQRYEPAIERVACISIGSGPRSRICECFVCIRIGDLFDACGVGESREACKFPAAAFPHRDRLVPPAYLEENGPWLEPGNTAIIGPSGAILAGPVREKEETLIADLDLGAVLAARRHLDPVGHYNRPDVFRLQVDTSARPAFVEMPGGGAGDPARPASGETG